ncbi:MAG: AAA family ATPase [Flavonifractor plautii]|nr:AAA family ATPase [Flavonifractor plautii]MDU6290541.1 AAA family ATPase [Flavonifractor plautii]MDU6342719.1 AAA family ATPase [Flavonifractor plautii]
MFDKDGFMPYVGSASGSSYAGGLKAIETIYGIDIDAEYQSDKCIGLLQKLEQDKKSTELNKTELKRRSDMTSHLKKYVEYCENRIAMEQRKLFVSWMQNQPRRDDPTKKYSIETINGAADKLQSGLKKLGVPKYAEVNCFTITNSEYFSELHKACYSSAESSDKKQGHRDFRNGLDFYMQFLNEQNNTNLVPVSPIKEKIKSIIEAYKADFERVNQEERYKWEAVGHYKKNWNIDADNFSKMYAEAFKEAHNLLAANMYWPYKMVITFAEKEPAKVRELFKMLYNESIPLAQRYVDFRAAFDEFYKPQGLNHYQDLHAISVYLTFEYPDKYYIYKYKVFKDFSNNIGYVIDRSKFQSEVYKLEAYFEMCELVLDEVKKDSPLQETSAARLDDTCYDDKGLHLLTHDIVYFGSQNALEEEAVASDWWPTLDEYDPNLSKDDWKKYILEIELPDHPSPMQMLKAMMELGGEASCKRLSQLYGGTVSAYVGCAVNLGKRVKKYFDLPACMDGDQERFFPFPFLGKNITEDGTKSYCYKIRPELFEALGEIDLSYVSAKYEEDEEVTEEIKKADVGKNTILYGPPGTGKTYNTVVYAVAIIENKLLADVKSESYSDVLDRYNKYRADGLIEFTTFHQSYGYEEFIEGIKPVMDSNDDEQSDIKYSVEDGLFKAFCNKSSMPITKKATLDLGLNKTPTIWKVSLWSTGDNPTRTECLQNGHIRIGWDDYGPDITEDTDFTENGGKNVLNSFIYKMKIGDIVFSCYSSTTVDAIGVVTGDYEWCGEQFSDGLNRKRDAKWIVKGINEDIVEINGGSTMTLSTVYKMKVSLADAMALIQKHLPATVQMEEKRNRVFIIDEINRGNISKIFGELITLIEASKRIGQPEGMKAKLPYSQQLFGVPDNVYIIGTMNTADRSIATIDTALRRRFRFKEMMPDTDVLKGISVEDISVAEMLARMNKRISVLYDREHTIGHAYFIPLRDNPTIEQLAEIFENAIVPLLQEYFYEDYEKIRLVLGDNNKSNKDEQFIIVAENNYNELFGNTDIGFDDSVTYEINHAAFDNIEAYRSI